jgi:hypothetical protein
MGCAFLVFDLIGRNATLEGERNVRGFIDPEQDKLCRVPNISHDSHQPGRVASSMILA